MAKTYRVKARYDPVTDNVVVTEEGCSRLVRKLLPKFRALCQVTAKRAALRDRKNAHYAYYNKEKREIDLTTDVYDIEEQAGII
ncbi:hypothetical protein GF378_00205 [Candidatus Pacearchaeota archaeon]|nr:hypothetical protein [Candidatus Pacearchaeota archaeon]